MTKKGKTKTNHGIDLSSDFFFFFFWKALIRNRIDFIRPQVFFLEQIHIKFLMEKFFGGKLKIEYKKLTEITDEIVYCFLWHRYLYLDVVKQRELAKQLGSTPEQIIDSLLQLDMSISYFWKKKRKKKRKVKKIPLASFFFCDWFLWLIRDSCVINDWNKKIWGF